MFSIIFIFAIGPFFFSDGSDDASHIRDDRTAAPPASRVRRTTPLLMIPDPDCWVVPLILYEEKKSSNLKKNQAKDKCI